MKGKVWTLMLGLLAMVLCALPGVVYAEQICEEARALRFDGKLEAAEEATRVCIEKIPTDLDAWVELSRILAMQGHYGRALIWVDGAINATEDPRSYELWRARLLLWKGDYDHARQAVSELSSGGDDKEELEELSQTIDEAEWFEDHRANHRRPFYMAEMSYFAHQEGTHSWHTRHTLGAHFIDSLLTEVHVDGIRRSYPDEAVTDMWVGGKIRYAPESFYRLRVGGFVAPRNEFSPDWNAFVQPSVMITRHAEVAVRFQRVQFPQGGVHVINPRTLLHFGPLLLDARYYVGFEYDGRIAQAAMGRLIFLPVETFQIFAGGSIGNQAEYLEGHINAPQRAIRGAAGVKMQLTRSVDLLLDGGYRHEVVDGEDYHLYDVTTGVRWRFW